MPSSNEAWAPCTVEQRIASSTRIRWFAPQMRQHVAGKRQRNYPSRFDAPHEVGCDEGAVLDSEAWIAPRELALQLLIDAENHVDRNVAVRVRADLPAGEVGFARLGV
jgi:hypothetical protein